MGRFTTPLTDKHPERFESLTVMLPSRNASTIAFSFVVEYVTAMSRHGLPLVGLDRAGRQLAPVKVPSRNGDGGPGGAVTPTSSGCRPLRGQRMGAADHSGDGRQPTVKETGKDYLHGSTAPATRPRLT